MKPETVSDADHMRAALNLAGRGLGGVAPNPAVGCVIVRENVVVGRGWTQPGGRPHAETEALARAGAGASGATAYVTLEPCSHRGQTPPCAEALVAAGIARCVVAIEDPDPRVSGRGLAMLRAAGIAVETGLMAEEATRLNAGFLKRILDGRPLVTLKLASTLDGRIATHAGESRWITGDAARALVHMLRHRHDAVMVGSGTAIADDPELTVRLPGLEARQPLRIVVDGRLRTPLTHKLVRDAPTLPTLVITREGSDPMRRAVLADCGVQLIEVPPDTDGNLDLVAAFQALGQRGLTRILVEGGATLAAALLRRKLVDRLAWFRSAGLIGGDGLPAVKALGVDRLADQARATRLSLMRVGDDVLETLALSA
ncbi:MAG TPA: bifunctional diaminohydroxyphosphoribosylaminopyrimidine deaminase/5-amino-6-(5-phosphoribosylamino)uracil reductase RibD [Aliidongia sp.]|nr:bifunctional diaminohydroxyphosphoribosylaminopyrimidine deaminase/5-amino-6-(5-phosphoribosylamino)uracil reductase RibD [Aliidongia sp.]